MMSSFTDDNNSSVSTCSQCGGDLDRYGRVALPPAAQSCSVDKALCEHCYQQDRVNLIKQQRACNPIVSNVVCDACEQSRDCRFIAGFDVHMCDTCQDDSDRLEIAYLVEQGKHLDVQRFEFPDKILDGVLYLGSKDSSIHEGFLLDMNIQQVVVCCNCLPLHFVAKQGEEDLKVRDDAVSEGVKKIRYLRLPVRDSLDQDLLPYLHAAIAFIAAGRDERHCATLVHCHAGISRSASVVIAYLMQMKEMSFDEARSFVKSCRKNICPNSGFVDQLRVFQQRLQQSPPR